MKIQKDTIIVIIVCAVFIFGWTPFCRYMGWSNPPPKPQPQQPAEKAVPVPAVQPETPTPAEAEQETKPAPLPLPESKTELPLLESFALDNPEIRLEIDPNAGKVGAIDLKQYFQEDRETPIRLKQYFHQGKTPLPGALEIYFPGAGLRTTAVAEDRNFEQGYLLRRRLLIAGVGELNLEQRWELAGEYVTNYTVTLSNPGSVPLNLPSLVISAGEMGKWIHYSKDKIRTDPVRLDYCSVAGEISDISADTGKDAKFFRPGTRDLLWTSLSNKYLICMLQAETKFELYQARIRVGDKDFIAATGARYEQLSIPAGGETVLKFKYYAGPKIASQLEAFSPLANRAMHLAWGPLDYLARFMLWALIQLKNFCGSYGWSIVLLTVIVRLIFWPVTARANASMKKMSALQPKMKELREQYKDNPQMLNAKTMELYRTEKVNPMGGCLPMLMQLPILFALYATLDSAVELRQVPFLWAKDLAAADTTFTLFGVLPVNPLVICWSVLMFLQQRMTPTTMDPMQQKMMQFMPLVMLIFVYPLPSGLTLYFTVGQIFSIFQMLLQQKLNANAPAVAAASGTNPTQAPKKK